MLNRPLKCKANILLSNFGSSRGPVPENLCRPLCKNLCRRDTSINPDHLWFINLPESAHGHAPQKIFLHRDGEDDDGSGNHDRGGSQRAPLDAELGPKA